MTNPTTPFSWQMPTASDLVTDLPADFETFGQAVATSMADLLGGTTGQVLSKASNTDMDFTWVAADDTNAIQNAIVDAKGDLIAASAADTPARLAVGNNGETLVADSSTSTGLRYTAGTVQSNPVINSAFQVWQRGTSFSIAASSAAYTADRWYINTNAAQAITVSRQATNDTTNLPFIQYCQRIQRNSGQTGTAGFYQSQFLETVNSIPYAGKTITYSFYARAGANFSASSNTLEFYLQYGTGTDQGSGLWTGQASAIATSGTLTTTWQRFTATATLPATATQIKVVTGYVPTGTASTNDYYELTGVQIDIGSVALPFRTYAATIQGELAACQRYYYRSTQTAVYSNYAQGACYSTTGATMFAKPPVTMRTTPTAVDFATIGNYRLWNGSIAVAATGCTIDTGSAGQDIVALNLTAASGLVAGATVYFGANNNASTFLGLSAEL